MPSVRAYYRHLRSVRGAGRLAATQWALGYLLAVVLLRLEEPAWQSVLADRQRLYPHLAGKAPSLYVQVGAVAERWRVALRRRPCHCWSAPVHGPIACSIRFRHRPGWRWKDCSRPSQRYSPCCA